ncbi:MAG: hypothetical protein B7Y53_01845 [Halothiobacillus sp. 28-55-5]|nr:MAG: hypothetical protein B7Y53_01845 [Halothiobacillus sp. 28-55-5]
MLPKNKVENNAPAEAASIMGINVASVYWRTMSSSAKITAASGVLNEAAIAAAAPQPTKVRTLLWGKSSDRPSQLPPAAPRWMPGPSRPLDRPTSRANVALKNCTTALGQGKLASWR